MEYTKNSSHSIHTIKIVSTISGKEIDLVSVFDELNIFHDIDNQVTTGYITIKEQGNLINYLPIKGEEYLEIKFSSYPDYVTDSNKDLSYHRIFFVYAVDSIHELGDSRQYAIRFTDALGLINNDVRLSIRYKGSLESIIETVAEKIINKKDMYSKHISTVMNTDGKILDLKKDIETSYNLDFVVPNWKPLKMFSYLTSRAVSKDQPLLDRFSDCLFFQDTIGKFRLTSYDYMFNKTNTDKKRVFVKQPLMFSTNQMEPVYKNFYYIANYSFTDVFNIQSQKNGMLGHTTFTIDIGNRSFKSSPYPYSDSFDSISKYISSERELQKYTGMETTPNSAHTFLSFNINSQSEIDNNRTEYAYPTIVKGIPLITHLRSLKVYFELNGSSDLEVGVAVRVDLKEHPNSDIHDTSISSFINGDWVISKVKHTLTPSAFSTFVECFTPCINTEPNVNSGGANETFGR